MTAPTAETTTGTVEGRERRGVQLFAGIPYAAPPTGARRFLPPAPAEPWTGVRDARRFGPAAHQPSGDGLLSAPPKQVSEDCLSVNVVTPACDDGRRPVFVWIHGGGFRTGTGAIPWYDGSSFASHDVVVVTVNYRLGALGFCHLEPSDPELAGAGNAGLADQLAALRWVQDNIAGFGGDPANVTVAGESAGAMSVASLCGAPASAGLFRRAVAQSGAASHVLRPDSAAVVAERFVAELGADPRTAPAEAIVDAQARTEAAFAADPGLRAAAGIDNLGLVFQPVVEPSVLPRPPQEAVADGASADVDLLVGTNLDEFTLFLPRPVDEAHLRRGLERLFGEGAPEAEAAYRVRLGDDASPTDVWLAVKTDEIFRQPAIRLAEAHRGAHWMYLFTWPSTVGNLGATHALEIPFVFDTLAAPGIEPMTGGGAPQELADAMHGAWTSFCRGEGPGWDAYEASRRSTQVFGGLPADRSATVTTLDDPLGAEREVWSARS